MKPVNVTPSSKTGRGPGFALITAMIFLLVLTLVAITAIRGTSLELKMSANKAMRTEALEASEASRALVSRLIDAHTFSRGWPVSIGGSVTDEEFAYPMPPGLEIIHQDSKPRSWYLGNTESLFDPLHLLTDARFSDDAAASGQTAYPVSGELAVFKLRISINAGSGAAMMAGYEGTGKGMAASGGAVFYAVQSRGSDPGNHAVTITGADYRHVIRN